MSICNYMCTCVCLLVVLFVLQFWCQNQGSHICWASLLSLHSPSRYCTWTLFSHGGLSSNCCFCCLSFPSFLLLYLVGNTISSGLKCKGFSFCICFLGNAVCLLRHVRDPYSYFYFLPGISLLLWFVFFLM